MTDLKEAVERVKALAKRLDFTTSFALRNPEREGASPRVAQNTELAADLRTLLSAIERLEGKRNTAQREREDAFDHINGWKERALAAEARAKAAEDDAAAWKADAASQFLARKSAEGALRQIADAPTPPHQNGHYLQARNAVNISRAHFTKHSKGGET